MKYYYLSHEGPFRNNIVLGKDIDRINRDKNKIVVTRINGSFHVLICKKGIYEKEKLVLSYFELVNFLKRVSFNVYFVNVSGETAYFINSYVKKDDEVTRKDDVLETKEAFYAINDDNMLQIEAYVDRDVLKRSICTIYGQEVSEEDKCHEVSLVDFIQNEELFELYHLPFVERNGQFLVPNYSYAKPKPFYILSGIYNKSGDVINLSGDDLKNIYLIGSFDKVVANDILSHVEMRIVDQHTLESVNSVVEFLEKHHNGEEKNCARLRMLREHIIEANGNRMIVESIKLLSKQEESDKVLVNK